jgi:conjugative relaxase-like TrwC/TraI family protein
MVASIAPMARGQDAYYTKLAREDYYLNGGEPPGQWLGSGSLKLGLGGMVDAKQLSNVLAGYCLEGRPLVKNAGAKNRQVGWDMTFSAPKSVSVLWGIGDREQRKSIEAAHNQAVMTAVDYLEKSSLWSRTGKGGFRWQKAEAVVAAFLHGTTRDADPGLHTHCLFTNLGIRQDGTTGTIVSKKLYQNKMLAGAIYRSALAYQLTTEQGLELKAVQNWFEVKGVPQELCDHFSKRSQAIKSAAGAEATAAEKDRANLTTRSVKGHICREELHPLWKQQATQFGFDYEKVGAIFQNGKRKLTEKRQSQVAQAEFQNSIDDLASSNAYFSGEDLFRKTLEGLQTGRVEFAQVLKQYEQVSRNPTLRSLGQAEQSNFYTSSQQASLERELLENSKKLMEQKTAVLSLKELRAVMKEKVAEKAWDTARSVVNPVLPKSRKLQESEHSILQKLNKEQREVLQDLTCSFGSLKTFSGRAGTGKTTLLSAARRAWESQGLKVVGCAVTGMAAQQLSDGSGIRSETVALRLKQFEDIAKAKVKHHATQLLREALGRKTYKFDRPVLDKKTVLVIDEASMISTKDLNSLLKKAKEAGAKVVLAGDLRQLPSITAGGAFAVLHKETKGRELTKTVRQKTPWLHEAVNLLADGDQRAALTKFSAEGRLCFGKNHDSAKEKLIENWNRHRTKDLKETVILARTNEDVDDLNRKAQDIRRHKNELGWQSYTWNGERYHKGDRIAFHEIDRKLGVWNGDRGTIRSIKNPLSSFTVEITVELDRGGRVTFRPRELKNKDDISLGYATTIHKSQGMTTDKTFLLCDEAVTSELSYVGLTRSRYDTFIHTQTKHVQEDVVEHARASERLARKMARSQAKQMANTVQQQMTSSAHGHCHQLAHGY